MTAKTAAQIIAEIAVDYTDNMIGAITPAILRSVTSDIVNSIMPTAPVGSGNFASYNGTTGLLQDSGIGSATFPLTPQFYGAKGDGVTDDTVAVNAWLAAISAAGATGYCAGVFKITSALTPIVVSGWGINGAGPYQGVISYQGAPTTVDILTIGNGTTQLQDIFLANFRITSTTTMTAGNAIRLRKANQYLLQNVTFDGYFIKSGTNTTLWNGFYADNSSWGTLDNVDFFTLNNGVQVHDATTLVISNATFIVNPQQGNYAILAGGGVGGVYLMHVDCSGYNFMLNIDNSLSVNANNQFFVLPSVSFEQGNGAGVQLNDSNSSFKLLQFFGFGSTIADTQGGNGIQILNWKNGTVAVTGGRLEANAGSGIYDADASTRLILDSSTQLVSNAQYGVFATVPVTIWSSANAWNNTNGNYSSNVIVQQDMPGQVNAVVSVAPSTPASGIDALYVDSTDLRFHDKNSAGTIGTTVVSGTAPTNQFANSISSAGVVGYAQPALSNLSGYGTGVLAALEINVGSAGAPVLLNGALGSPSSAGTMPAFTMGGNITMGGNNITGAGEVLATGAGGLGYSAGAGGAVSQLTSRTTGVTLNKVSGAITLFAAAGSATAATFTVTNSTVAATDTISINQKSGTNLYNAIVTAVAAGSFNVTFFTTGGTASDSPVFNFNVIKGAAS